MFVAKPETLSWAGLFCINNELILSSSEALAAGHDWLCRLCSDGNTSLQQPEIRHYQSQNQTIGGSSECQETFIWQHSWKYYLKRAPRWLLGTQYFPSSNLRGPIIWGLLSAPSQSVLTAHKVMVSRKNLYFDKTFGEKRRYSESTSNIQLMENFMNFILYFA